MRRRRVLVVFAAAAACVGVLGGAGVARSASGSRIVFAASRGSRWFGGIYRVTATGRRLDLAPGPAPDLAPVVSPDGRWVAFLGGRGGEWAFYVVGIDGRGLHRISARLSSVVSTGPPGPQPQIVWAPNSRSLAAELRTGNALYLGSRSGMLRVVAHHALWSFGQAFAWSSDGRFLAYSTHFGSVRLASPSGKRLWSVRGEITGSSWSSDDRLAVAVNNYAVLPHKHTVTVYDREGHVLNRFRGSVPAWSPGGTFLASVAGGAVWFRREGRGKPIWSWRPVFNPSPQFLQWVGPSRMREFAEKGWIGLDVAHKRLYQLGALAKNPNSVVSPRGQVLAEQANGSGGLKGSKLLLSGPGSSKLATLASGPYCGDSPDFSALAFVPHRRGVVYQTSCLTPPVNIYSVNPDGSGLRQLTHGQTDDYQPSLSPDGQSIVYVQQSDSFCEGVCLATLWRIPTTGGTPQQLTSYSAQYQGDGDQNPTWSPDGSTIAFHHSGDPNGPGSLQTIPASGGNPQQLDVSNALLPAWGPHLIAFSDDSTVNLTIKTFDPTTNAVQVVATGGPVLAQSLAWSKSGQLAYLYPKGRHGHAFVAIAASTSKPIDLNALFPPHTRVGGLAWSPDGTRFAFTATDPNGYGDIYTIAINGTDLRQVTKNIGGLNNSSPGDTISWR